MPNQHNAAFAGVSIGPLRSMDLDTRMDSFSLAHTGSRRKILSGEHLTKQVEVRRQEAWPNACLDADMVPDPPEYQDLTPLEFCAGWTGKILGQMDPSLAGSVTENQLRHLNRLLTYSLDTDFDVIKSFGATFLRSVEFGQNDWSNWPKIDQWQRRQVESLNLLSAKKKLSKGGASRDGTGDNPKKDPKLVEGVPESFIRSAKLCIAFQRGTCSETSEHTYGSSGTVLAHSCAICLKMFKEVATDHNSKTCPNRKEFFLSAVPGQ